MPVFYVDDWIRMGLARISTKRRDQQYRQICHLVGEFSAAQAVKADMEAICYIENFFKFLGGVIVISTLLEVNPIPLGVIT